MPKHKHAHIAPDVTMNTTDFILLLFYLSRCWHRSFMLNLTNSLEHDWQLTNNQSHTPAHTHTHLKIKTESHHLHSRVYVRISLSNFKRPAHWTAATQLRPTYVAEIKSRKNIIYFPFSVVPKGLHLYSALIQCTFQYCPDIQPNIPTLTAESTMQVDSQLIGSS